ncbi:DUF3180 domain-containing protein [Demequina sp. B12]|uniref:DUF3180 domain-containing protein n=1 Tax=Demequina sp. B12 TaxID=2992757 RepID=UPI00237B1D74|nr:DUF3180 domain-containing protein [Demequina sp. B12]MDE0573674.1 DUF3180 domain-containing protein [Demequina sp. B12]
MQVLTWQRLTLVGLVSLALVWLGIRLWDSSGSTPPHVPWSASVIALVAGGVALWLGWQVRRFLKGKRPDLSPLRAARTAVYAQACALVGVVLAGGYGGFALGLLDGWSHTPRREVIVSALIAAGSALVLMAAGVVAERWCRHSDEDDDRKEASPA